MVRKCMNQLKKKEYPIIISKLDVDKAVELTRVVNKKVTGATYAGRHVIQINFGYWQFLREHWRDGYMKEYDAYKKNKVYGNRTVTDMDDRLFVVVAHEVAHHVQRRFMKHDPLYHKSHGQGFQRIYRWLRQDLVNPIIDAKIKTKVPNLS